jgi:hypothetical protein
VAPDVLTAPSPDGRVDLKAVLNEARSRIKGSKRAFCLLFGAGIVIVTATTLVLPSLLPYGRTGELLALIAGTQLNVPFTIALTTLALRRTSGLPASGRELLEFIGYFPHFAVVALLAVLPYVLVEEPLVSAFLGFLLSCFTAFAGYFILDRDMQPLMALWASLRLFVRHARPIVLLWLLGLALGLASVLTLGVGLVWVFPFVMIAQATVYAHATGLQRFAVES